MDNAQMWAI